MLRRRDFKLLGMHFVYKIRQNTNRIRELIKHEHMSIKAINREKFINKLFGVDTYTDVGCRKNQYTYEQLKNTINFQTNNERKTIKYYREKYLKKTYYYVNLSYFFYCKNKMIGNNRIKIIQMIQ